MQDIRRQLKIGLRWLPLVVACAVVAGAIAYAWSSGRPNVYEATGTLIVDVGPGATPADLTVAEGTALRYAFDMDSVGVAQAVIDELALEETPQSLLRDVEIEADPESTTVQVVVRAEDPVRAQAIAAAFGEQGRSLVRDTLITDDVKRAEKAISRIERNIRFLNRRLNNLRNQQGRTDEQNAEIQDLIGQIAALDQLRLDTEDASRGNVRNRLQWFAQPRIPTEPVEPRPVYWSMLALVAGGMAGAALALMLEYLLFGRRVRDERDLEQATALPVLGTASERRGDLRRGGLDRLVMLLHPGSASAEAYKGLVAKIGYADGSARTLLVAGPGESDRSSVVAANIALAYAEASRNVILVDSDYRSPRLHQLFDVPNDRGLTNLLSDQNVPLGWVTVPTVHPRLGLLPAGPRADMAGSLSGPVVNVLMRRLMHAADMVVFAGPPIAALDCAVLASNVEGAVLVVPAGSTTDDAAEAAASLEAAEARLTGAVLYRRIGGSHPRRSAVKLVKPRVGFRPRPEPDASPKLIPAIIPIEAPSGQGQVGPTSTPSSNQQQERSAQPEPRPRQSHDRHYVQPKSVPSQAPSDPRNGKPQPRPSTQPPSPGTSHNQPWAPTSAPSPWASNGRRANGRGTVAPPPYSTPYDPQRVEPKRSV